MRLALLSTLLLASSIALAAPAVQGAAQPEPLTPEAAAVKQAIQSKFPGAVVGMVSKAPYLDLYEVQFDDRLVYTDAKATYVILGSIYDANTKQNLTEVRVRQLNRVAWDSLPMNLAFVRVKGDGSRKLAIFSDADCPFCKQLEKEMKGLDNVTIYTFLFPISELHPDAPRKSAIIWCSADKVTAWNEFFDSGKLPDNKGDCATPIKETAALGHRLRVTATPTLMFADGTLIPGAMPLARLEDEINKGEAEAKKLAAVKK